MMDPALEAEVHRLYQVEGWPIGTIARELKLHHSAVERVVRRPLEARPRQVRPTMVEPYLKFIHETLERWPDLTARRLYDMCVARGYPGAPDHFRAIVRTLRPERRPKSEAFLRLRVHPGEQGQVDWGHFGHVVVGRARRQLLAFVVVLSWSRMVFVRFFLGAAMPCFLRGHVEAFEFFGGVPRTNLYDNLKSAVLERDGDAIHFHPTMLQMARHYRFEPRPVGVRKGNEKGRVERAIRFIRDSFFSGRQWTDIDDLNRQARDWCLERAAMRPWADDRGKTVRDAFEEERPRLLELPSSPFPCDDVASVVVGKTPYVRFDGNDYTVPSDFVKRTLTVSADEYEVRILDGTEVIARHERCYDKGEQIEDPSHVQGLRDKKRKAKHGQFSDKLRRAAPSTAALIEALAERGENLGSVTAHLGRLLDRFGAQRLEGAVRCALERGTPHPRSVQTILEVEELRRGELPRIEVQLPDDDRLRDVTVRAHDLSQYDCFAEHGGEQKAEKEADEDDQEVGQ
jgi:transposase